MKRHIQFGKKRSNRNRNIILILAVFLTVFAIFYDVNTAYTKENKDIVEGLANSLIRFHVIANSDTQEDQALKVKVKDEVIKKMQILLTDSKTIDESREIIVANMEAIKTLAVSVIKANGFSDTVTIALQQQTFPLKQYGDIVLPPGEYESLVIRIGAAQGKNWWCILFPPLCFVDATHGVVDDQAKASLEKVLTAQEYSSIIMDKDQAVDIKVKSKLMQWLKEKENTVLKDTLFAEIFK